MAQGTVKGRAAGAGTGTPTDRTDAQLKTDMAFAKADVGLGNVDNVADASKPVSTAQQAALDLKAPLISPALVTPSLGTPSAGVLTSCTALPLATGVTGVLPHGNLGTGGGGSTKFLREDSTYQTIAGGGDALVSSTLDQFADVTQTPTKTLAITESTTLAGGTHSGTNTGDQTAIANATLATMATKTYKGRTTAGTGAPEDVAVATLKTDLVLVKADVGLGSVDNTSDAGKPVSTAQQTALDLKANLAGPTFTDVPAVPTAAAGTNTTQAASTAFVMAINNNASYRKLLQASASHIAGRVAGTYALAYGNATPAPGAGTLFPLAVIQIVAADYPTIGGLATKLRIRAQLYTNDVAPTGNFTFGLYPITRPATSGGAGLNIFTLGAVVSGSNGATFTTPAADLLGSAVGSDFALPADGPYVIAVVTTATVATSSHVHLHAQLQMRNA